MDEKRIERIEEKVDSIDEKQDTMNQELAKMNITLQHNHNNWVEHMRRTEANEMMVDELKTSFVKHLGFVKGAAWVVGILWVVSLAVAGIALRVFL